MCTVFLNRKKQRAENMFSNVYRISNFPFPLFLIFSAAPPGIRPHAAVTCRRKPCSGVPCTRSDAEDRRGGRHPHFGTSFCRYDGKNIRRQCSNPSFPFPERLSGSPSSRQPELRRFWLSPFRYGLFCRARRQTLSSGPPRKHRRKYGRGETETPERSVLQLHAQSFTARNNRRAGEVCSSHPALPCRKTLFPAPRAPQRRCPSAMSG